VKNVVVTGSVHVGKSTVCLKVVQWARCQGYQVRGIVTTPLYDPAGGRQGFEIHDLGCDEHRILARVDCDWKGPQAGPFHFDPAALRWGEQIVERALGEGCELLVVDEIGRLELEQEAGFQRLLPLLAFAVVPHKLIVVRDTLLDAFRKRVPTNHFSAFDVTAENRDSVPGEIIDFLFASTLSRH